MLSVLDIYTNIYYELNKTRKVRMEGDIIIVDDSLNIRISDNEPGVMHITILDTYSNKRISHTVTMNEIHIDGINSYLNITNVLINELKASVKLEIFMNKIHNVLVELGYYELEVSPLTIRPHIRIKDSSTISITRVGNSLKVGIVRDVQSSLPFTDMSVTYMVDEADEGLTDLLKQIYRKEGN